MASESRHRSARRTELRELSRIETMQRGGRSLLLLKSAELDFLCQVEDGERGRDNILFGRRSRFYLVTSDCGAPGTARNKRREKKPCQTESGGCLPKLEISPK